MNEPLVPTIERVVVANEPADTVADVRTFETLDGLRGAAAIIVMIWHIRVWQPLPSAYLAVDLFFMLSGFVLAYRYDARLASSLSLTRFMVMRGIRLYPLYLLGTLIGAGWAFVLLTFGETNGHIRGWAAHLILGLAMIPNVFASGSVYPFNSPAWSLFYEIVVNAAYALGAKWSRTWTLMTLAVLSAIALVVMSLVAGNLHFTVVMPSFLYASIRAVFGFVVGILLFRWRLSGEMPGWKVHPLMAIALLVLLLSAPSEGIYAPFLTPAIVILGFPVLLVLGINSNATPTTARVMNWLGLLSFPLYAIHRPIWSVFSGVAFRMHASQEFAAIIAMLFIFFSAWIASEFFDKPVRVALTQYSRRFFLAKH